MKRRAMKAAAAAPAKAMKVMKKKAAMKRRAMKAAAPVAMKAMKAMSKKAAMKRRAMKAAAPVAMKAMRVMKKKKAMKAMKAMKTMKTMKKKAASALTKTAICDALATKSGIAKGEVSKMLDDFSVLATAEVKKTGKFTIPGLCMLKTRIRPARKAGTTMAFGKKIKVKARKAKKIVKAYCVSALKKSI